MLASCLLVLAAALAGSISACSSDSRLPGLDGCEGTGCTTDNPTGVVDSGIDTAVQDAAVDAPSAVTISGQVVRIVDTQLLTASPYTGSGVLQIPTASGDLDLPFVAGATFSTKKAASGSGWFRVRPDEADAGVLSSVLTTHSFLYVPPEGATDFQVPVLDRDVLSSIYFGLAGNLVMKPEAAQVIFAFSRGGKPIKGVKISGAPTADTIAYDDADIYSTFATATGSRGVAILVNVTGAGEITVISDTGASTKLTAVYVKGEGTYIPLVLP